MSFTTTLPNGIKLSESWPPAGIDMTGTTAQAVPYLDVLPDVIDIRKGRQLFVDSFLIEPRVNSIPKRNTG